MGALAAASQFRVPGAMDALTHASSSSMHTGYRRRIWQGCSLLTHGPPHGPGSPGFFLAAHASSTVSKQQWQHPAVPLRPDIQPARMGMAAAGEPDARTEGVLSCPEASLVLLVLWLQLGQDLLPLVRGDAVLCSTSRAQLSACSRSTPAGLQTMRQAAPHLLGPCRAIA